MDLNLNLSSDELKFRDELRAWLAANVPNYEIPMVYHVRVKEPT
jgi:hypothetical protein